MSSAEPLRPETMGWRLEDNVSVLKSLPDAYADKVTSSAVLSQRNVQELVANASRMSCLPSMSCHIEIDWIWLLSFQIQLIIHNSWTPICFTCVLVVIVLLLQLPFFSLSLSVDFLFSLSFFFYFLCFFVFFCSHTPWLSYLTGRPYTARSFLPLISQLYSSVNFIPSTNRLFRW